jgi:uncharacterized membrane protein YfcA
VTPHLFLALALGMLIGVSLGLLGGGGSILAVPVLVYVAGVDVHTAIGTSLAVVGATALVGGLVHARAGRVDARAAALFGGAGMLGAPLGAQATHALGALVGVRVASGLGPVRLRRAFAVFVILVGLFLLVKNVATA